MNFAQKDATWRVVHLSHSIKSITEQSLKTQLMETNQITGLTIKQTIYFCINTGGVKLPFRQ
jgi:hypothetical protein